MKQLSNKMSYIVIAILLIGLVAILSLTGCNHEPESTENNSIIKISASGTFTEQECQERGFENKVIMFESKYCGHCKATLPDFQEACEEKGIVPEILDLSVTEELQKAESYNIEIMYTPTFIIGCDYYIGTTSKEEYLERLDSVQNNQR